MPIQQPTSTERNDVRQYLGSSAQVSSTTCQRMRVSMPLKWSPSSTEIKISPMPNRPITATRKSKPRSSSMLPKVSRNCPLTVSRPTAANTKPSIVETMVLAVLPLPIPTNVENTSS
jgi:hypothetical protein